MPTLVGTRPLGLTMSVVRVRMSLILYAARAKDEGWKNDLLRSMPGPWENTYLAVGMYQPSTLRSVAHHNPPSTLSSDSGRVLSSDHCLCSTKYE